MLKLILPLTTRDHNKDRKDVEPLALLVHPQQPLSYLERLIQSELPMLKNKDGSERIPQVYFRAEDSMEGALDEQKETPAEDPDKAERRRKEEEEAEEVTEGQDEKDFEEPDHVVIDGKKTHTGKLNKKSKDEATILRGGPGEGGVESYSGLGHEAPSDSQQSKPFVRWSSSTEIGDFIRDAARGQEFAVEIEGAPSDIRVGVPSFNDRTYYLRMRLRGLSRKLSDMAHLKKECDEIAHRSAHRVAI